MTTLVTMNLHYFLFLFRSENKYPLLLPETLVAVVLVVELVVVLAVALEVRKKVLIF